MDEYSTWILETDDLAAKMNQLANDCWHPVFMAPQQWLEEYGQGVVVCAYTVIFSRPRPIPVPPKPKREVKPHGR